MIVYLDTSVVLSRLLEQDPQLDGWGEWEGAFASELMGVEARRTFDRLRLCDALDDSGVAHAHQELAVMEDSIGIIGLGKAVLRRAALPMPTVVKTLDAIHLATAMLFRETRDVALVFATHDERQALAAHALGFAVIGLEIDDHRSRSR